MIDPKRYKITLPLDINLQLDLKRLTFRLGIPDERVAIICMIHMISNMRLADFDRFVKAYTGMVNEYSKMKIPKEVRMSKLDDLGGVNMLRIYKNLDYNLEEVSMETNVDISNILKYLEKWGLKWSEL